MISASQARLESASAQKDFYSNPKTVAVLGIIEANILAAASKGQECFRYDEEAATALLQDFSTDETLLIRESLEGVGFKTSLHAGTKKVNWFAISWEINED
jgi:hypothetical protein